jgi:hypothetical protein
MDILRWTNGRCGGVAAIVAIRGSSNATAECPDNECFKIRTASNIVNDLKLYSNWKHNSTPLPFCNVNICADLDNSANQIS